MFHVFTGTYLQPPDVMEQHRSAHRAWLQHEIDAGRLILAGRKEDLTGGILITADISAEDADVLVAADPYCQAGVARYEKTTFNAAFRAPGL